MKIKFVKEYRALFNSDEKDEYVNIYKAGDVISADAYTESAQWLIDNGFAEEVEESSLWEPNHGEKYYYIDGSGCITTSDWKYTGFDAWRHDTGNVFKTYEAAVRYRDYLEAVATVRHDDGFMKPRRKIGLASYGYAICHNWWDKSPSNEIEDSVNYAGKFYFDTSEHAEASIKEHESEWQTILDYDWSKGEDEEDED